MSILDADKEGFLRSGGSLIQVIGRAARNIGGRVLMYADRVTDSMRAAIDETDRRRVKQAAYNVEHGITPQTIKKQIAESLIDGGERDSVTVPIAAEPATEYRSVAELARDIAGLRREMRAAAQALEFEKAAEIRDRLQGLEAKELELRDGALT